MGYGDWKLTDTGVDAADQTVIVGDRVVYTVGDESARRLQFGRIEKIRIRGPFTHTWKPNGQDAWEKYEYYEYKYTIRHSERKDKGYWVETGVSLIEGRKRILALPDGMYEWVFETVPEKG